jgi:hypothetical protein
VTFTDRSAHGWAGGGSWTTGFAARTCSWGRRDRGQIHQVAATDQFGRSRTHELLRYKRCRRDRVFYISASTSIAPSFARAPVVHLRRPANAAAAPGDGERVLRSARALGWLVASYQQASSVQKTLRRRHTLRGHWQVAVGTWE